MRFTRDLAAALLATAAICVVVGLAFLKTHGPRSQRLLRADETRLRDLGELAGQINLYYKQHQNRLPDSLTDQQKLVFRDPLTHKPFEYSVKSPTQFSLCADFSTNSPHEYEDTSYVFWEHGPGHKCFDLDAVSGQAPPTPYIY